MITFSSLGVHCVTFTDQLTTVALKVTSNKFTLCWMGQSPGRALCISQYMYLLHLHVVIHFYNPVTSPSKLLLQHCNSVKQNCGVYFFIYFWTKVNFAPDDVKSRHSWWCWSVTSETFNMWVVLTSQSLYMHSVDLKILQLGLKFYDLPYQALQSLWSNNIILGGRGSRRVLKLIKSNWPNLTRLIKEDNMRLLLARWEHRPKQQHDYSMMYSAVAGHGERWCLAWKTWL